MNKLIVFAGNVCSKVKNAFNGTTINADTGVVEQHQSSVSRPSTGFQRFAAALLFVLALACVFSLVTGQVFAATDIDSTVTSLSSTWTTIEQLAIGVLLFVLGRRMARKV